MKAITQFMVAGALVFGAACSSTNTGTTTPGTGAESGTTSGSTETSVGSGAGAADTGTGVTGTTSGATDTSGASTTTNSTAGTGVDAMAAFVASFSTMEDHQFLITAASSNLLEIQLGKLATQKSTNAEVKKFGQMMVDHHTKATQELTAIATPLNVTLPETMLPIHRDMADRLMNKSGKDFDEEYMDAMETAHKLDIAMFEAKSKATQSTTVTAFATKTLPMLRSHHTMASEIEKKVD